MANPADFAPQVACAVCAMGPLCHARDNHRDAQSPVEGRMRVAPGETLYRDGAPRDAIFAIRAGCMKLAVSDTGGGRHIVRFLLPGDVVGLDALAGGDRRSEAVALEHCEVCRIPCCRVEIRAENDSRTRLRELLAAALADGHAHAAALAGLTAAQRVASFLLDMSRRWAQRGFSGTAFRLPMQRRELGEHLGMTMETVSRVLSDFQAHGWLRLTPRAVEILAGDRLLGLLESARDPAAPG
jgi:CRP/FNR family transcriptional regulator